MWKKETIKFTKPKEGGAYIPEMTRFVPERHVHPKSIFIDTSKADKDTAAHIKKATKKKGKEPIDYGITKEQFYQILDKASQPVNKEDKHGKEN
jgi:hypothetical protein